jgi:hypothetical protein
MPRNVRFLEKLLAESDISTPLGNESGSTQGNPCILMYAGPMTGKVRITIDGKLALTVEQAAERYHLQPKSISAIISRGDIQEDGTLDGKKKLYLASRLDAIMKARPGKGATLRKSGPGRTADGDQGQHLPPSAE